MIEQLLKDIVNKTVSEMLQQPYQVALTPSKLGDLQFCVIPLRNKLNIQELLSTLEKALAGIATITPS